MHRPDFAHPCAAPHSCAAPSPSHSGREVTENWDEDGRSEKRETKRMKSIPRNSSQKYPGLLSGWDHDRHRPGGCLEPLLHLNEDGEVVDRGRFRTNPSSVDKWFIDLPRVRIAMEAGTHSIWIEEASELTTFDILKRSLADGRIYYLLHVKPSKFDRARVIPIGDGLGRVLAEIIRHVKRFYNSTAVPICDHWDLHEKRPRPPAPYLLQGIRHPSTTGIQTIRDRIRCLSISARAQRSDGSPLVLLPHDCRRVFAFSPPNI